MLRTLQIAVFIIAGLGLFRLTLVSELSLLHVPPPVMLRGEAKVLSALGQTSTKLKIVELEAWQKRNAELKAKLGEMPKGEFLTVDDLPSGSTIQANGKTMLILPSENGITVKAEVAKLFDGLMSRISQLLVLTLGMFLIASLIIFRKRVLLYVTPIIAALVATLGLLGWLQLPVSFFQLLTLLVIAGIGVDYVIFHREGGNRRVILGSFLSSLIGFGMLSFTSYKIVASMGITFASGLCFAYFFSIIPKRKIVQTNAWQQQAEQSAGKYRIYFLWIVYRYLGKSFTKILFVPIFLFIYPFCSSAKTSLGRFKMVTGLKLNVFKALLNFSFGVMDKLDACSLCKNAPKFKLEGDLDWLKGGAFLISSHLGTIEVLPALRNNYTGLTPKVHAFQQMKHNPVFTELFAKFMDNTRLTLHSVENIGVETAVEMHEAIRNGELVLMAGDRLSAGSAATLTAPFFNHQCAWPMGVFRFAELMEARVFIIVAVRTGWNTYTIYAKRLTDDLLTNYTSTLETLVRRYPEEWFQFYDFFSPNLI